MSKPTVAVLTLSKELAKAITEVQIGNDDFEKVGGLDPGLDLYRLKEPSQKFEAIVGRIIAEIVRACVGMRMLSR